MPAKVSFADWLKRAIDAHGDLYDYSNSEESFQGASKHVLIKCRIHGDFQQIAKNHTNGSHCPECAAKTRGKATEDLSGKVFGKLTAIRLADERRNGRTFWILRCQCGNEIKIQTNALKKRKDPTCGNCGTYGTDGSPLSIDLTHHIKSFSAKGKDVSGQRFGKLIAKLYYVKLFDKKPERRGYWHCECDCGKTAEIPAANLLLPDSNKHATRSCGCEKGGGITLNIGDKFERLTVVGRGKINWKAKRRAWRCKCDCGVEVIVSGKNLVSGHTKSCGCLSADTASERFKIDITGERYGRLVALKRLPDNQQRKNKQGQYKGDWKWQCDCGNTHVAPISVVRA